MKKLQVGKTYSTRSACDHDCIISVMIEKRTAKTVSVTVRGEKKTFRIGVCDDAEFIKPWGYYSMAPVVTAND